MTRIDFHTGMPDAISYACRLIRKAYTAKNRMVVRLNDRAELAQIDEALWTFSDLDFLPHVRVGHRYADDTPIILTDADFVTSPKRDLLINLANLEPQGLEQFERVVELVTPAHAPEGRARYRTYQQRGFAVEHFDARPK